MQILFVQVYLLCNSSTEGQKSTPLKCSLVGLHGGRGIWRMNQTTKLHGKTNSKKKRHIAILDTDSENSYSASQPTKSSSSSSSTSTKKKPYVPRFLIIHSEKGETISSLSPFVVHKTILRIAGEPKSIKNLRSCDLLIQCAKESHEKSLLQMKTFCSLKCSVTQHSSLNTSKGII